MCHIQKIMQFKDRRFVYACAVDLRTSVRKVEEKPSMQTFLLVSGFSG